MSKFQPGESGNPGGKPKQKPLTDALRMMLLRDDMDVLLETELKTPLQKIAFKLAHAAMAGDMPAIRECFDRIEGKPVQALANDPENPLETLRDGILVRFVKAQPAEPAPQNIDADNRAS